MFIEYGANKKTSENKQEGTIPSYFFCLWALQSLTWGQLVRTQNMVCQMPSPVS